jgi:drug/metabolite transporter (DMT)-like permease
MGPTRAAYMLVLIPILTVAYSVWLLDEPVGSDLIVGGVLVIGGVYMGAFRDSGAAGAPLLGQAQEHEL